MALALLSALVMNTGCTKDPETNPADTASKDALLKASIVLTDAEIESLMFMVEEEKLAMDVYNHLFGIYELKIFEKIAASEVKHVTTMSKFFEKYELTNPIIGNDPGIFVNPDLQDLYTLLILEGEESRLGAINVGIMIETKDLEDIQFYLDNVVEAKDLTKAYTHLLEGSMKHLAAFEGELE
jgi:hypothetical protein